MIGLLKPSATVTRRSLLLAGAGAAATAAMPRMALAASKRWSDRFRPHLLRSSYEPLVGTSFKVGGWAGFPVQLQLAGVADIANLTHQTADFRERAFVLSFRGPASAPLALDTYRFSHKRLGKFDLAISSSTPGGQTNKYSVVIANAKLRGKRIRKKQRRRARRP